VQRKVDVCFWPVSGASHNEWVLTCPALSSRRFRYRRKMDD
jgi:hypothetical protein